jgi:amino acid adenylation domain-containing protein
MLDLAKTLTKLPPGKRQLLELLIREQGVDLARLPISAHRSGVDSFPLSFAQQRLWFLDKLEPGMPIYNMPLMVKLTGELKIDVLERTFSELIRRHEVFRTSFPTTIHEEPVQVISPPQPVTIKIEDLTTFSAAERETELRRRASREAAAPFDLEHGPMFRLRLLRMDSQEHVLLLTLHHIISDGWSMGVMIRELGALYTSFYQGETSPLPELPIQYADFALWQREWLSGSVLEQQLEYWRQQLGGELPVLALEPDKTRAAEPQYQGAAQELWLSAELSAQLRELSVGEGVTMFMVLLAGWQLLLSRYSGQEDICVGTPIANRNRAETEELIGFFVNTLVLRTDLSGDPSVRELLGRVREVCLGAYGHQDMPFEKLVEALAPERDLGRTPLFQTMFNLQQGSAPPVLALPGLQLEQLGSGGETVKFDLMLSLHESAAGVQGELSYRTELFAAATMARLLSHYEVLLQGMVANPEQRLSELSLLTAAARQQLLVEWNETAAGYPVGQTITGLFEAQVARTPAATALVCAEQEWSYGQLNQRANQLAHQLRAQGVGPEVIVGVCVERSAEMVVALLGILKAGGAYLPIDPAYPRERINFMMADAGMALLLTQAELAQRLELNRAGQALPAILLDREWEQLAARPTANLAPQSQADNLAYLIYTSGSTGRPKGVAIEHRSAVALLHWAKHVFPPPLLDGVLAATSICFDLSVFELFLPLSCGGRIILVENALALAALDEGAAVSLLNTVPSVAKELLRSEGLPASVRTVNLAGEALSRELVEQLYQQAGVTAVYNLYGPSEDTTYSTFALMQAGETNRPSIGRPIWNTQAYVLGRRLELLPPGVAGELYLGGAGLARGYLRRPELTAERFVPHPYSAEPGARLYRTGDRARYLADGNLEYLRRLDEQVKLRGYRIELGEIEAVLRRYPGISDCAVLVVERSAGEPQLTAYVVSEADGAAVNSGEWQRYLQQQLPEYMVPAQYVRLGELPLTANGKLDRRALALLEPECDETAGASLAARSPVEQMLQSVWQELLGRERVGIHENFFALGGHSLLATRLISRVRVLFQIELPLRALFDAPTVAALAARVEQALGTEEVLRTPAMTTVSRAQLLPLSYAQERLWFLDQLVPDSALYNIPQAVRVRGELSLAALSASLSEMVRRHETLRTHFKADEAGGVWQEIEAATAMPLEVEDLQAWEAKEREQELWRRVREEASAPFDLSRGPLLRMRVLRLSANEHVLLMTLHHIISDGWSMGVMIRELGALYTSFYQGETSPLPELPIQYADFALWQREWLSGSVLEQQLEYWRQQLGGELPVLALEPDKTRAAEPQYQGAAQELWLSAELSAQLRELSVGEGVTMFMVLLAGWQLLLSRYSGQEDICVGTPIANRNRAETEELIGFFVNTLVLRTDLSGDPSVRELLGRVREVCLGAYGHQDMPFEKLVEALAPERDLGRTPLFQTMFNLQQGSAPPVLALPGLQLEQLGSGGETVKFDLMLSLHESAAGVQGELSYRTELFAAATMARLLSHYEVLLQGMVANPEQRLSELSLLTAAARQQLLVEWNETAAGYPVGQTITGLFEAQVARTPAATALVCAEQEWSYGQLNQRANQLAHQLRAQGVGPEVIVGVCVERSAEMVVALLGILKAGGAYLPIDPAYPRERINFMMADAGMALLLTQAELAQRLELNRAGQALPAILLDREWEQLAARPTANLAPQSQADNLAYLIYTSGSTGRPKGVAIEHRSAVALLHWAKHVFPPPLLDGVLAATSICFDLSVFELFLPLSCGGRIILVENALALAALDEGAAVSLLNTVPSVAKELLRSEGLPASVRTVNLAGEALSRELVEQLYQQAGVTAVYNLYGPSEDTTYSTFALMQAGETNRPSIGRPIWNTQAYVLGRRLELLPPGVAGELYLGGAGLARGYLRRPELTAERFVPHPYSAEPGARLYRTGDRARYLADGNLEYLRRLDEQVKLRGYRIELGEIEAVLRRYPGISDCAVLVVERSAGEPQLTAYVVSEADGAAVNSGEWQRYLQQQLPEYMVPAQYVRLGELPLTANGKLDRRALALLEPLGGTHSEREYVPARDLMEQKLVQIWEDVLKVKPIGVKDDFFQLGGHSLLAVNLMARIRSSLGQKLPLSDLFQGRTIESLAQLLRKGNQPTDIHPALVEIQSGGSEPPLFCVHAVGGTVFSYIGLAQHLGSQRPFYGLQSKGLDGKHHPHLSVEEMATYYIDAVTSVQPDGPYLLAGWSMGGIIALEMARQLRKHGHEVARLLLIDSFPDHGNNSQTVIPDHELLASFLEHAGIQTDTPLLAPETLQQLTPEEQLAHVLELARSNAVLPPDTNLADIQNLFEVYKANVLADGSYVTPPIPCPATLFKASEQPKTRRNEAIDRWSALASAGLEVQLIPGNHFSMLREPNVEFLARSVRNSLTDVPVNHFVSVAD